MHSHFRSKFHRQHVIVTLLILALRLDRVWIPMLHRADERVLFVLCCREDKRKIVASSMMAFGVLLQQARLLLQGEKTMLKV